MMRVADILKDINELYIHMRVEESTAGSKEPVVSSIEFDSRKVVAGSVFVAINGVQVDGHAYITKAIDAGASIIVCEKMPSDLSPKVTYVQVEDAREALAIMASNFYGYPSREVQLIGITGTNGKTSTVTILHELFQLMGQKSGLLSTVENRIGDTIIPSTHTTPDPLALNSLLRQMVNEGCEYVFMEVSSHALSQKRVYGLQFKGAVFTNISHDHLDYHGSFDEYIKVKKSFFDTLESSAFALTNVDDKRGNVMLQNTVANKVSYGLKRICDYKGKVVENAVTGLQMELANQAIYARLVGRFNAYNLLSAYGVSSELGFEADEILPHLSQVKGAEGRFDVYQGSNKIGIVDYAHTPDALLNVLMTIQQTKSKDNQVITVVGCGGDRDKLKRPKMAAIAVTYSDKVIFTSDNPRSEDPNVILEEMTHGLSTEEMNNVLIIENREQAIKTATVLANSNAIILVAGKGHEKYQEIKGVKTPFDDKAQLVKNL